MKIAGSLIFKFTKVGFFLAAVPVAMVGPSIEIAIAASTPLAYQPYVKGKLRETLPTFFCLKREDANALIELMEARRLEKSFKKKRESEWRSFSRRTNAFSLQPNTRRSEQFISGQDL